MSAAFPPERFVGRTGRPTAGLYAQAEQMPLLPIPEHRGEFLHQRVGRAVRVPPSRPEPPVPDLEGYDLRPDPLTARTPAEFMQLLRDFRVWSGEPSYRTMARDCGRTYGASTLCTALNQNCLPSQQMLKAIITACGGDGETLRAWVTAWRRLVLTQQRVAVIADAASF